MYLYKNEASILKFVQSIAFHQKNTHFIKSANNDEIPQGVYVKSSQIAIVKGQYEYFLIGENNNPGLINNPS